MGIEPDDTYVYTFKVKQNGTYWYHSHSGLQEQEGVYGAIIIDAREPEPLLTIVSMWSCCLTGPMKILTAC